MGMLTRMGAGCALVALAVTTPATAGCWTPAEREAAQVRELQTMLMVASLRCGAAGIDIVPAYNGFVRAARARLEAANLRIKTHFATGGGAQEDYDRFTTALANAYGDDETSPETCAEAAGLAGEATASVELARLASTRLFPHALPGDGCAMSEPKGVIVAVATPAAPPPVVVATLPGEVVSALAVMARYGAASAPAAATPPAPIRVAAIR